MKRVPDSQLLVSRLAVLADMVRLRMMRVLEREELSVGEVARVVQLPQSTVSRHLSALAGEGWLVKRQEGTATLYRLLADDLAEPARELWRTVRRQIAEGEPLELEADLRRLGQVLADRRTDSRSFFGRVAGEWYALRASLFGDGFTGPALLSLLDPRWVVADLGCGSGDAARLLAPHVARVIGVDQSEAMLDAARGRLGGVSNIELVCGDLESLPLADGSVDAAVLSLVLHHVDDPGAVLAEVRRVLRGGQGGGVAVVIDMPAHDREEYRRTMGHRHLGFTGERMVQLLTAAGFSGVRTRELATGLDVKGPGLFVAAGRIGTE